MKKLLVAVAILLALGGSAAAQSTCGPHAGMIIRLAAQYSEARLGVGRGQATLFEMWANIETGSWTILEVFSSGMACIRAAGEGWKVAPPVPSGNPV